MRICKDLLDFGRGFTSIHETLGEDSQVFVRIWEKDSQGIARLCERICKDLKDFGGGFVRVREHLGEDFQGFTRLWGRICKNL